MYIIHLWQIAISPYLFHLWQYLLFLKVLSIVGFVWVHTYLFGVRIRCSFEGAQSLDADSTY